jgi:two-component system phosphate regulon response regulator OmpR
VSLSEPTSSLAIHAGISWMSATVLFADGDAQSRGVYSRFLSERGYAVQIASNGLDCLEKLRQARPAVLVLDLELRWGGGDGVLAYLREDASASRVAVILLATPGYPPAVTRAIEPPVVSILPKPFVPAVLLESVRAALAEK